MSDETRPPITDILFSDSLPKGHPHLAPVFDLPTIRYDSEGGGVMLDRFAHIMRPQTAFLNHLSRLYAVETFRSYARCVLDIERTLAAYKNKRGLRYDQIDDAFLTDKLRQHMLHERSIQLASFRRTMMIYFRFLQFAQSNGFCRDLIGASVGSRIYLPNDDYLEHPCVAGSVITTIPVLPTHDDFLLIERQALAIIKSPRRKRRFHLLSSTAKTLGFRRSELARLTVSMIPTRRSLAVYRRRAELGLRVRTVEVMVPRSKRGGTRMAHFPLALLEELRDYIDHDRPLDLKPGVKCEAIFVSSKTGLAFRPQSITNLFKIAAKQAAVLNPRDFGQMNLALVRPHHYRHRAITDMMRNYLANGMTPSSALLVTMDAAGIKSLDTASRYMHIAQAEIEAASPAMHASSAKADRDSAELFALVRHEFRPRTRRRNSGPRGSGNGRGTPGMELGTPLKECGPRTDPKDRQKGMKIDEV